MTNTSPDVFKNMCDWWLRKARNLKRKGTPSALEVLHRLEEVKFPARTQDAPLWCSECLRVLPKLQEEPAWYAPLRNKLVRWSARLGAPTEPKNTTDALDAILAGKLSLDEALSFLEEV